MSPFVRRGPKGMAGVIAGPTVIKDSTGCLHSAVLFMGEWFCRLCDRPLEEFDDGGVVRLHPLLNARNR